MHREERATHPALRDAPLSCPSTRSRRASRQAIGFLAERPTPGVPPATPAHRHPWNSTDRRDFRSRPMITRSAARASRATNSVGKSNRRSPFDFASIGTHRGDKFLAALPEDFTHFLVVFLRWLRIDGHALHDEWRPSHPGRRANEVRVKLVCQSRSEPNPPADFAVHIHMNEQAAEGHSASPQLIGDRLRVRLRRRLHLDRAATQRAMT